MRRPVAVLALIAALPGQDPDPRLAAWQQHQRMTRESPFAATRWRAVGPRFCGGRIEDIEVAPGAPYVIWVAPGAGNLWKSTDAGLTWKTVFEHESTFAIGDVAVAPSNPDVVWVGTGEAHLSLHSAASSRLARILSNGVHAANGGGSRDMQRGRSCGPTSRSEVGPSRCGLWSPR